MKRRAILAAFVCALAVAGVALAWNSWHEHEEASNVSNAYLLQVTGICTAVDPDLERVIVETSEPRDGEQQVRIDFTENPTELIGVSKGDKVEANYFPGPAGTWHDGYSIRQFNKQG